MPMPASEVVEDRQAFKGCIFKSNAVQVMVLGKP